MPLGSQSSQHRMHFSASKHKRGLCTIGAAGLVMICVFLLVLVVHGKSSISYDPSLDFPYTLATTRLESSAEDCHDVYNETLGVCTVISVPFKTDLFTSEKFQEIFLVSLPERTDRRDSFAVQARLSNMSFTVVDGVDGTTVPAKALPYVSLPAYLTPVASLTLC